MISYKCYFIIFFSFLVSCAKSPVVSGAMADENLYRLSFIAVGMGEQEVLHIMGRPSLVKVFRFEDKDYMIWYYFTYPYNIEQLHPIPRNFTPVVFQEATLTGFGYPYLRELKQQSRLANKENNSADQKISPQEHGFVPAPPYEKFEAQELKNPKTFLRKKNLEEDIPHCEPVQEKPVPQNIPTRINSPVLGEKQKNNRDSFNNKPVSGKNPVIKKNNSFTPNKKKENIYKYN